MSKFLNSFLKFTGVAKSDSNSAADPVPRTTSPVAEDEDESFDPFQDMVHKFSSDARGSEVESLWNELISTDEATSAKYIQFCETFLANYSDINVYAAIRNSRRSSSIMLGRVDAIEGTIAHPEEVIVYVANSLMEFIACASSGSRNNLNLSAQASNCRDEEEEAKFQRMLFLEFPNKTKFKKVFSTETGPGSGPGSGSDDSNKKALLEDRVFLLYLLRTFGVICRWPQNVRKLKEVVGPNIITLYSELFRIFERKLDECVEKILADATSSSPQGATYDSQQASTSIRLDLIDDCVFCLNGLMIGVQFCGIVAPEAVTGKLVSCMGITPAQPWSGTVLRSRFYFPVYPTGSSTSDEKSVVDPFFCNKAPTGGVSKLTPPASELLMLSDCALSWVERLGTIAAKLYEYLMQQPEDRGNSFIFQHQLPLLLVNVLTMQTEALQSYMCLLLSISRQPPGTDTVAVVDLWSTRGCATVKNFLLPSCGSLPTFAERLVRDLVLQRGLLCIRVNDTAALAHAKFAAVPENVLKMADSSTSTRGKEKSKEMGNEGHVSAPAPYNYEVLVFDTLLGLCKWLHRSGHKESARPGTRKEFNCPGYDPASTSTKVLEAEEDLGVDTCRKWAEGVRIQAVGPAAFCGSYSGCDLWPWCQSTEGDESFFGGSYNSTYRLCTFSAKGQGADELVTEDSTARGSQGTVRLSYLYMKDAPVFMIAGSPDRLGGGGGGTDATDGVTPPWLSLGAVGKSWEIIFAVILGVCYGPHFSPSGKALPGLFTDPAALRRLGTVFSAVVGTVLSCLNDPYMIHFTTLPVLQSHFLVFLVRCFKQSPVEVVALSRQCNLMELLLGDNFLGGGWREAAYLLSSSFASTSSRVRPGLNKNGCSETVVDIDLSSSAHGDKAEQLNQALAWVFLHDASVDVVRCLLGAAASITKEQMEGCHFSLAPGGVRKDIVLLLQALARTRAASTPMDDVVLQLVRLLCFTMDDPSICRGLEGVFARCLTCCMDLTVTHLEAIGIRTSYPHDPFHHDAVSRVETRRPFLWLARSSTLRLISKLVSLSKNEWMDCFLEPAGTDRSVSSSSSGGASGTRTMSTSGLRSDSGDMDVTPSGSRTVSTASATTTDTASDSVWSVSTRGAPPPPGTVGIPAGTRSGHGGSSKQRGYYHVVASLLFDRRCRDVAIFVLVKLLVTCGLETITSTPSSTANMTPGAASGGSSGTETAAQSPRSRSVLRILACDIIQSLLFYVGYSSKHSPWCDSFTTSNCVLKALTCMLRNRRYGSVRSCLQDFFRKGDSIAHLLDVLKNCTRSSSSSQAVLPQYKLDVPGLKLQILRQGLSLLTAIMLGSAACKNEFKYVMSSSPSAAVSQSGPRSGSDRERLSTVSERSPVGQGQPKPTPSASNPGSGGSSSSVLTTAKFTRYHNFKLMLLQAEPTPSLETFALLIEMLLDAPCLNSRSFIEETGGDPDKVLLGAFANNDERPTIQNYCVVPCIMCLVPLCPESLQICMINTLHNLVIGRASLLNLANCSQSTPLMLDLLMDLFPVISDRVQEHAGKFMETLGQYSLSVAQLKHMFRLIHSQGEFRPSYSWRLLHALQGMVTEEHGPHHFFVFEGTYSGLKLPPIMKWPSPRAFSVCMWLRISPLVDMYDAKSSVDNFSLHVVSQENIRTSTEYTPYVLCLRSDSGQGCEIFLKQVNKTSGKYELVIQSFSETGEVSTFTPTGKNMMVTDGEWHFLALTMSVSSAMSLSRKSEACVMLDDSCEKFPLQFPYFGEPIMEPLIGECVASVRPPSHNTTMRGQMGAFYLFTEVLAEGQLHGIRELGPDYFYCFEPDTGMQALGAGRSPVAPSTRHALPAVDILDGSLTSLVALTYNPAVWSLDYFLDNTPDKNPVKWKPWPVAKGTASSSGAGSARGENLLSATSGHSNVDVQPLPGKMHARRILPGTYRSSTQNVRMALDSLGGLKAIFPLFVQLDQPRLPNQAQVAPSSPAEMGDSLDQNFCITILELLHTLLDHSVENQALLHKLHGLQLVAYFLERVSPLHLSSTALDIIIKLYDRLSWSIFGQNSIVESLLCNFKLWVFTPYEVQYKLFNWLVVFTEKQPNRMREVVGAQQLLDDLYLLYGYDLPHADARAAERKERSMSSTSADGDEAPTPTGSRRTLKGTIYVAEHFTSQSGQESGERLPPVQLKRVRGYILHMLYTVMTVGDAPIPEDVESLIEYIAQVESATAKIEGLRLLLHLMNQGSDSSTPSRVLLGLTCCYGVQTLLPLHSHVSAQVRMYALLIFCKVVNLAAMYRLLPPIPVGSKYHHLAREMPDTDDELPIPPPPEDTRPPRSSSIGSDLQPRNSTSFFPSERRSRSNSADVGAEEQASPLSHSHKLSMIRRLMDMSSFEALGMHPSTLVGTLLWVQDQLMQKLSDDVDVIMMSDSTFSSANRPRNYSSSSAGGGSMGFFPVSGGHLSTSPHVLLQCKIIAAALQLTLLGAPCDHLAIEVDKLFAEAGEERDDSLPSSPKAERKASSGPDDDKLPPLSSLSSLPGKGEGSGHIAVSLDRIDKTEDVVNLNMNDVLYSLHKVEYTEILSTLFPGQARQLTSPMNRTLSDARICVPMIFPSLLLFLRHDNISHALRLSILVNMKLLLSLENCEKILKIPAWQDYVFQLIASESVRLKGLLGMPVAERDNRSISKAEGVIDTCVRMICDITCAAVKIGRPVGSSEVTRPDDAYTPSYNMLDLASDLARGERQLGVTVLRETIACLAVHTEHNLLNAKKLSYEIIKQTIDQVQHEKESEFVWSSAETKTDKKSDTKEDTDRLYGSKLFDLNAWLLASIVLEVVTSSDNSLHTSSGRPDSPIRQPIKSGNTSELDGGRVPASEALDQVDEDDSEKMWTLVLLLVKLVRQMDGDDDAGESMLQSTSDNDNMFVQGVVQMGITGSVRVVNNINDSVDAIVPPVAQSTAVSGIRGRTMSSQPHPSHISPLIVDKSTITGRVANLFTKAPLLHAAGGVSWMMIRVLCNVFAQGGDVVNVVSGKEGDFQNRPLTALVHLKNLINVLKAKELDHFDFECLHVLARVVDSLRRTALDIGSEWVVGALSVVKELSSSQPEILKHLLLSVVRKPSESTHRFPVIANIVSRLSTGARAENEDLKVPIMESTTPSTGPVADVTREALLASLVLPSDVTFTWQLWDVAMQVVFDEALQMEGEMISQKFTELGMHRHSQEVRAQIVAKCALETRRALVLARDCEQARQVVLEQQARHTCDMLRALENQSKRCKSKWTRIVQEVANERGPWGSGADIQLQSGTFWMLDASESDRRVRHQLRRNEHGGAHRNASLLQRGIYSNKNGILSTVGASVGGVAHGTGGSSTVGDAETTGGNAESDSTATDGLWKDLVKYKGETSTKSDAEVDEDGGGSDEEEGADAASGSKKTNDKDDHNSNDFASTLYNAVTAGSDRVLFSCPCQVITVASSSSGGTTQGTLEIYRTKVTFTRSQEDNENPYTFTNKTGNPEFQWVTLKYPSTTWPMAEVRNIFQRYFQLRFVGIELFFTSRSSVLFNLFEIKDAKEFYYTICRKVKPPNLVVKTARKPKNAIHKSFVPGSSRTLTQAWTNREISNFDYLMHLNTIAGRSFHDMSNYCVFPWVIADYTSKRLDLRNPKTFRNFRYPMGAQTESAREFFHEKYKDLQANYEDELEMSKQGIEVDLLPPYHYGSHYSCMGFIVWYMLRLEPFTSLHVWLQDGKFDKPDRLFDSVEQAYVGCTTNQSDVKELVPEFFCCPEIFDNCNNVDFGTRQNGMQINNVQLPPWARNAQEFVRINREALESDYVSRHLHHWIDLVFGYKQRPPHLKGGSDAAVEACNVFFFLTYCDAIDLEALRKTDMNMYDQTVRRIDNFGQTPIALFDAPHPQRASFDKVDIIWPIASAVWGADTILKGQPVPEKPRAIICFKEYPVSVNPVVFISELRTAERLVTVDASRIVGYHSWQVRQPDVVPPYALKLDTHALRYSQGVGGSMGLASMMTNYNSTARDKRIGMPFASQVAITISNKNPAAPFVSRPNGDGSVESVSNKQSFEEEEAARQKKRQRVMKGGGSGYTPAGSGGSSSSSRRSSTGTEALIRKSPHSTSTSSTSRQRHGNDCTSTQLFAALPEYRLLFSCGHWDASFKVTAADTCRQIQSIKHHRDVVSCIATATDFGHNWLVTGSRDCTVIVWEVNPERVDGPVNLHPLYVLYGHDDVVTTVAVNAELDLVVSGSEDGTVILHSLREGAYVRSIVAGSTAPQPVPVSSVAGVYHSPSPGANPSTPPGTPMGSKHISTPGSASHSRDSSPIAPGDVGTLAARKRVHWVGISKDAFIIMYSSDGNLLFSYTLNGKLMAIREAGERLYAFCLSEDGKVILTGGERRLVVFRWTRTMDLADDGPRSGVEGVIDGAQSEESIEPFSCPIRSICLSSQERHLLVGLENGSVRILAQVRLFLCS